jgi:hypothetical protein
MIERDRTSAKTSFGPNSSEEVKMARGASFDDLVGAGE